MGSATSVKSTRAVFYNLLNGKFAWHKYSFTTVSARRSPGSGAEFHVAWLRATLFSFLIYTGKNPDTICRQNFMDSVVNGRYFRETCADEFHQPFPSVLCSWHSRESLKLQ